MVADSPARYLLFRTLLMRQTDHQTHTRLRLKKDKVFKFFFIFLEELLGLFCFREQSFAFVTVQRLSQLELRGLRLYLSTENTSLFVLFGFSTARPSTWRPRNLSSDTHGELIQMSAQWIKSDLSVTPLLVLVQSHRTCVRIPPSLLSIPTCPSQHADQDT